MNTYLISYEDLRLVDYEMRIDAETETQALEIFNAAMKAKGMGYYNIRRIVRTR